MRITLLLIALAMTASAGPCLVGSLADYIGLGAGGCSLGATPDAPVVKGFTITPGLFGATPLDAGFVTITPIDLPSKKGLNVAYSTTAVASALETFFQFQITGPQLVGVAQTLANSAATGDGAVTGLTNLCRDGSYAGAVFGCSGTDHSLTVVELDGFSLPHDAAAFPVASFFDVFFELTLDGGLNGTATGASSSLVFTQTPEPGAWALTLCGGLALAGLRHRFSKQTQPSRSNQ